MTDNQSADLMAAQLVGLMAPMLEKGLVGTWVVMLVLQKVDKLVASMAAMWVE